MENTVAFSTLTDLITIVGNFFTTPFVFGVSFLQIAIIIVSFYFIINIMLGGRISSRHISREEDE